MADIDEVKNTNPDTFHGQLEVDSVVSERGCGYYDANAPEDGSRISHPQPLTGHPPQQNDIDGSGEHRLVSNIERDGRLESRDRFEEFIQARRRATEEMDKVYRICEELHAENERLRREAGLYRECRGPVDESLTKKDRIIEDQKRLIEMLKTRCDRLLAEVAHLRQNDQLCEEAEDDQLHSSLAAPREKGLASPKQTESVGNAFQSVDPMVLALNEGRTDVVEESASPGGALGQMAKAGVEERPKTPSPEDCAKFLADKLNSVDTKMLLRNMNLSSVTIEDLEERHPRAPMEYRIEGIKTGIISAEGDRIAFLLDALRKSKLNHQMDQFCDEFKIQRPSKGQPTQAHGAQSAKRPLQASSANDFADSPGLEPQSDFETVIQPYLKDLTSIHTVSVELSKEVDFTPSQLKQFKASFPGWKLEYRMRLERECISRCTMDVLNVWASIQVEGLRGPVPVIVMEFLAKALRASGRLTVLEKLKDYLKVGVVGPSLNRDVYLRKISPYRLKVEIIKYLGLKKTPGHDDWRALCEHIGHGYQIQFWEEEPRPAETVWNVWKTRNDATVGKLYDWAVSKNRSDIAALLEMEAENIVYK